MERSGRPEVFFVLSNVQMDTSESIFLSKGPAIFKFLCPNGYFGRYICYSMSSKISSGFEEMILHLVHDQGRGNP